MSSVPRPGVPFTVRFPDDATMQPLTIDDRQEAEGVAEAYHAETGAVGEVVRIYTDEEVVYARFEDL